MRREKRTTYNQENATKRKTLFKQIGGSIALNERIGLNDGSSGKYAGIRQIDDYGKKITLGCYDLEKGVPGENYRHLPEFVFIQNKKYDLELRKVEKPEYEGQDKTEPRAI